MSDPVTVTERAAKRIYRTLELDGYARIDFRLSADGVPYYIEANPNPEIARAEEFASAEARGDQHVPDGMVVFHGRGSKEAPLLRRGPDLVGFRWRLRRVDEPCHVFGHQLPADGEVERLAES